MTTRTITATGKGRATAQPDLAKAMIKVCGGGPSPQLAHEQATEQMAEIRAAVADTESGYESIRTTNLRVRHRSKRLEVDETDPECQAIGTLTVDHTPDGISEIVLEATTAGGRIEDIQFGIREDARADLQQCALREAMADARTQAETLAAMEDLTVDTVEEITTQDGNGMQSIVDEALKGPSDVEFEPDPVAVSAEVRVTYSVTDTERET